MGPTTLKEYWEGLPEQIRELLFLGSKGKNHLNTVIGFCGKALEVDQIQKDKISSLVLDIYLSLLEQYPWDREIVNLIKKNQTIFNQLIPYAQDCLRVFEEKNSQGLDNVNYQNPKELLHHIDPEHVDLSFFEMLERSLRFTSLDLDLIDMLTSKKFPHPYEGLKFRSMVDFMRDRIDGNHLISFFNLELHFTEADYFERLGNIFYILGDRDQTVYNWKKSLELRPWNSNLILQLYDIVKGIDREILKIQGKIAICFYTYNKAEKLGMSLDSLFASEIMDSKIFILLNGCKDNSGEIVKTFQAKYGIDRLKVIALPVNVGAPAARNWLMTVPEVADSDYVVYLDDDIILPKDWLLRLGGAIKNYPEAAVYGCMILDPLSDVSAQGVDWQFYVGSDGNLQGFGISSSHFSLPSSVFTYMRPAGHVTGCCHLFKKFSLKEIGDFDLRFSPSQVDDVDHDIRAWMLNRPVVYNGHLKIKHLNEPSLNPAAIRLANINFYKLSYKYTSDEWRRIYQNYIKTIGNDMFKKICFLSDELKIRVSSAF